MAVYNSCVLGFGFTLSLLVQHGAGAGPRWPLDYRLRPFALTGNFTLWAAKDPINLPVARVVCLVRGDEERLVSSPKDLRGRCRIRSESDAKSFVRLFTDQVLSGTECFEVVPRSRVSIEYAEGSPELLAELRQMCNWPSGAPDVRPTQIRRLDVGIVGCRGITTDRVATILRDSPVVRRHEGNYVVTRLILNRSAQGDLRLFRITEEVGSAGEYRTVGKVPLKTEASAYFFIPGRED